MLSSNNNIETGNEGERIAEDYLIKNGFRVLERNYRFKRSEIDLIATKDNLLLFVEVKTRKSTFNYGLPEEAVNKRKTSKVLFAAENYIYKIKWGKEVRFDVISIIIRKEIEVEHIEDAFY